jgi:hypothetical protein
MVDNAAPPPPVETAPNVLGGISAVASAQAPFLYFEAASAFGVLSGVIRVTLEAQQILPGEGDKVSIDRVVVGHLRMSIPAALSLKTAIEGALLLAAPQATEAKN